MTTMDKRKGRDLMKVRELAMAKYLIWRTWFQQNPIEDANDTNIYK